MLDHETKRKLRLMNVGEFIDAIELQEGDPAAIGLTFDERFRMATDRAYQQKYNADVARLIKNAKLRLPKADVHDVFYHPDRAINRGVINELATCRYIEEHKSVVIQGYTSTGKTYLGCALAKEACRHQYKTKYIRTPDLLSEFNEKSVEIGGKEKVLKKYAAFRVLVLDEWLIKDLSKAELEFLFELSERRFDCTSNIFCTLYRKVDWVRRLGKGTYAESISERYDHTTITIETGDMNMRARAAHSISEPGLK